MHRVLRRFACCYVEIAPVARAFPLPLRRKFVGDKRTHTLVAGRSR